jgi:hypothetical protein
MMDRKKWNRLFEIGVVIGVFLALAIWQSFSYLSWWAIAGILFALWMLSGFFWVYLIRRQGRRR